MVETLAAPLFWLYLLALTQTAAFFYSRVSLHQKSPRAVLWVTLPFIVLAAWATIRLWGAWDFRLRGWNGALGLPEKAWFVLCLGVAGGLGLSRLFWRWRILRKADARRKAFRSVGTGSRPPLGFLQSIGIRNQVYDLTVSEYELWLDGWPEEWSGLSITHLTDIHHGRFFGEAYLRQARREALALKSDLLAWTGDFVSSRADYAGAFDWMRGMRAPLGAWAVLGNHEGWAGRAWALRGLKAAGVHALLNQSKAFWRKGKKLVLMGAEDHWTGGQNHSSLHRASRGADARVLLAHQPDQFGLAKSLRAHLQLSGHCHGGQVCLPGWGALVAPSRFGARYASGFFREGETVLFVNKGVGASPPLRIHCAPEVVKITVRSAGRNPWGNE